MKSSLSQQLAYYKCKYSYAKSQKTIPEFIWEQGVLDKRSICML